jgi:hypothetical protein
LILPKAAPWLDEFELEYLAFPGKYDDQMDALSQFLNWRTEAEAALMLSMIGEAGFVDAWSSSFTVRRSTSTNLVSNRC